VQVTRATRWILTATAATAALTACGGDSGNETASASGGDGGGGGDCTIGVSLADQKSLFYIAEADGIKAAAEEEGVEIVLLSADNNSTRQVNQVNDLITRGVNALIFTAQDATAAAAGVRAANQADIPVIAVDQKPESGSGELATYIATDSVKAAEELATWLFEQMGGEGEIGHLQGVLGATAQLQRSEGFEKALEATPGIEVVSKQSANWDETEGYNAAQNMLQANPDIKAVFAESDAMALGTAKAARDANREVMAVGIDGFPTMIQGIRDGLTQATMAQVPYQMGQQAVQDAMTACEGGELPAEQLQDAVLVTQENVEEIDPVDFYGPNVK
jgi:ribose transport system substrate-binding protein